MNVLFFDTETYSTVPIRNGLHAYMEGARMLVATWAENDGPVRTLDATDPQAGPAELLRALARADRIVAHNAAFDRAMLSRYTDDCPPLEKWFCTAAQALSHGLPAALGNLGPVLGLKGEEAKADGKRFIRMFCVPGADGKPAANRMTHPVEWARFLDYAARDILAMRECYRRMPTWNYPGTGAELALWHLDQRVNDRGIAVDTVLVEAAIAAVTREQQRLAERTKSLTGYDEAAGTGVASATQRDALMAYIQAAHDVTLGDLTGDTVTRLLDTADLSDEMRELLLVRQAASTSSTAKYAALKRAVSSDGRLRGALQFCGAARTGRWGGRLFQPQNLARTDLPAADIATGIDAMKAGVADLVLPDVMRAAKNAVRGCLVAAPGKKLVIADLANIEGRIVAWLARQQWKLDAFTAYDLGVGPDLYKLSYASSFSVPVDGVTKTQRQIGKVCIAEGTPVLTERGWVPVESVTLEDRVWDGQEWVAHQGLIDQGVRPVVRLAGIGVTPDHLILTRGTWLPAQQLASCESTLCQALATGSENLPSWAWSGSVRGRSLWAWCGSLARVAARRIWSTTTTCAKEPAREIGVASLNCKPGSPSLRGSARTYDITCAGPRTRFTVLTNRGPLIVHNCELMLGYQGGVGAFITGAATYNIDLADMTERAWPSLPGWAVAEAADFLAWSKGKGLPTYGLADDVFVCCDALKRMWRDAHDRYPLMWAETESAAVQAVDFPGRSVQAGRIRCRRDGAWLRVGMPSGRMLCYPNPRLDDGKLTFMGTHQTTRKWTRLTTYGGRLVENLTQALARDVLAQSMPRIEAAGYPIVLHVHDEIVCEVPDTSDYSADELAHLMTVSPDWAEGLPLAAEGFETDRYAKQ